MLQLNWVILGKIVFQLFQSKLILPPPILFIVGSKCSYSYSPTVNDVVYQTQGVSPPYPV